MWNIQSRNSGDFSCTLEGRQRDRLSARPTLSPHTDLSGERRVRFPALLAGDNLDTETEAGAAYISCGDGMETETLRDRHRDTQQTEQQAGERRVHTAEGMRKTHQARVMCAVEMSMHNGNRFINVKDKLR